MTYEDRHRRDINETTRREAETLLRERDQPERCSDCNGAGFIVHEDQIGITSEHCEACNGAGLV